MILFRFVAASVLASVCIGLSGCGLYSPSRPTVTASSAIAPQQTYTSTRPGAARFQQEMHLSPDLPAWHDEREKLALALGDRTLDKSFDDTFDAMIIALANLGCRVNSMERVSGFITSTLPELPPELEEQLSKEARAQYAQARGYSPAVLEVPSNPAYIPPQVLLSEKLNTGITLTLARAEHAQTKVKLRFNGVYYPRKVEELYKRAWEAVDKQLFLNRTLG